ncbi:MAG: DUF1501 domain-containing protein [Planctomycetaceae bacterium]|nr:DUF1501 domain-containing protein [Planctomycetaceae bacterium]
MFSLQSSVQFGRPSRREVLRAGFLGLGGLSLADMLRAEAAANPGSSRPKREKSVILLFVHGGPSHLETYDMKPYASSEIRGPFLPVRTNVSGIEVCEHLPNHAKIADRFTLIRSCTHDEADHFAGHRRFLSGYGKLKPGFGYESYYPQVGAVANRLLSGGDKGMPAAIAVNGVVVNGPDYAAGVSEGYWSGVYRVPIVNGSMRDTHLSVDANRLDDRMLLQGSLDRFRREVDASGMMSNMDEFNRRAIEIVTSGAAAKAFDISREDPRIVEKYGDGYGRDALIARRLVEAGVRFVSVCVRGGGPGTKAYDWDDHAVNWDMLGAMNARLPKYDHVVPTLIDDLYDRGLNEDVLLIVTGEFGRTPRLEFRDGKIGRDHWPSAMSILISGGDMPMGQVIGATDAIGARPSSRPLDPHDILATIYRFLGINHELHLPDPAGRPIALTHGKPVPELF